MKHLAVTSAYCSSRSPNFASDSPISRRTITSSAFGRISRVSARFSTVFAQRIGGVKINIPMEVPQQVMLSGLYDVTPNWSLMGNVGWQNWSAFGEFPIGISAAKQRTVDGQPAFLGHVPDRDRTASCGFGEKWLWSAGFAYDSSPVSKTNRCPACPLDRQLRYGTGIQYQINRDITAGVACELHGRGPCPLQCSPRTARRNTCKGIFHPTITTWSRSMSSGNS